MAIQVDLLPSVKEPKIVIPELVFWDIQNIVSQKTTEIGWIGEVEYFPEFNEFHILKVTVPLQDANGSTTEINDEGLIQIIKDEPDFDIKKFRYWGHSHGNMSSVNPSSQDLDMMKEFASASEWFIGTIHNTKGDVYGYVVDNRYKLFFKDVSIIVNHPSRPVSRDWKTIVQDRVKVKVAGYGYNKDTPYGKGSYFDNKNKYPSKSSTSIYDDKDWDNKWHKPSSSSLLPLPLGWAENDEFDEYELYNGLLSKGGNVKMRILQVIDPVYKQITGFEVIHPEVNKKDRFIDYEQLQALIEFCPDMFDSLSFAIADNWNKLSDSVTGAIEISDLGGEVVAYQVCLTGKAGVEIISVSDFEHFIEGVKDNVK